MSCALVLLHIYSHYVLLVYQPSSIFPYPIMVTTQPGQWACPLCRLERVAGESWGSKQAYRMTHQPVSDGPWSRSVHWMPGWWLASGDQRRRTGSGSALETCRDDVLYKWPRLLTYLLCMTLLWHHVLVHCCQHHHKLLLRLIVHSWITHISLEETVGRFCCDICYFYYNNVQ